MKSEDKGGAKLRRLLRDLIEHDRYDWSSIYARFEALNGTRLLVLAQKMLGAAMVSRYGRVPNPVEIDTLRAEVVDHFGSRTDRRLDPRQLHTLLSALADSGNGRPVSPRYVGGYGSDANAVSAYDPVSLRQDFDGTVMALAYLLNDEVGITAPGYSDPTWEDRLALLEAKIATGATTGE